MPERPIDDLLRALDTPGEPSEEFGARLRSDVAAVFSEGTAPITPEADSGAASAAQEVVVVDLKVEQARSDHASEDRLVHRRRPWLVAAAIAIVLGVATVTVVSLASDDSADDVVSSAGESLVGSEPVVYQVGGGVPPYDVAVDGTDVWVLSLSGVLSHFSADGSILDTLDIPESSLLAADAGSAWIADAISGDVLRVDATTHEVVATIPTGVAVVTNTNRGLGAPMLAGDASRTFSRIGGIDASDGDVWVGDQDGRLLRINPAINAVIDEISVELKPDIVDVDGDYLMAADPTGDTVLVIDTETYEQITIFGPVDELAGAALYNGSLYVFDGSTGTVTRIDLLTGNTISGTSLGESPNIVGQPIFPAGVAAGPTGVLVETDTFHVLDPVTLDQQSTLALDGNAGQMTVADDGTVWIVRSFPGTLTAISPSPG